jgi:HlyD family secretion protein
MTANLQVVVAKREGVLKVPNSALRFRPKGETAGEPPPLRAAPSRSLEDDTATSGTPGRIFVLGEEGEPKLVPLRLGITDGRMTEVLAGKLSEGQRVITGFDATPGSNPDAQSILVKFRLR